MLAFFLSLGLSLLFLYIYISIPLFHYLPFSTALTLLLSLILYFVCHQNFCVDCVLYKNRRLLCQIFNDNFSNKAITLEHVTYEILASSSNKLKPKPKARPSTKAKAVSSSPLGCIFARQVVLLVDIERYC